ncbi:MAG: hypothetical protein Q7T71_13975 [Herbiconiux sp.]|nr:hypothetical protein [Herbiconiux sp.]
MGDMERRTVLGAAWAAPAVMLAVAVPGAAASGDLPPSIFFGTPVSYPLGDFPFFIVPAIVYRSGAVVAPNQAYDIEVQNGASWGRIGSGQTDSTGSAELSLSAGFSYRVVVPFGPQDILIVPVPLPEP